jgi:hypothetical protein
MEVTIGCVHGDENGHKAHKSAVHTKRRRGVFFVALEEVWNYIAMVEVCGDILEEWW